MAEPYFVYVHEDRHRWRFVHIAEQAASGDDAIGQAIIAAEEFRSLGFVGDPEARGYMAVPVDAVTTRSPDED